MGNDKIDNLVSQVIKLIEENGLTFKEVGEFRRRFNNEMSESCVKYNATMPFRYFSDSENVADSEKELGKGTRNGNV